MKIKPKYIRVASDLHLEGHIGQREANGLFFDLYQVQGELDLFLRAYKTVLAFVKNIIQYIRKLIHSKIRLICMRLDRIKYVFKKVRVKPAFQRLQF